MPLDHIDYKNAFAKDLAINKLFDKSYIVYKSYLLL